MDDLCRICLSNLKDLKDKGFFNIFSSQIYIKIMWCAKIQIIEDDNMPQYICYNCKNNLKISFEFRKLCEYSDNKLRTHHNTLYKNDTRFDIHSSFMKDPKILYIHEETLHSEKNDNTKVYSESDCKTANDVNSSNLPNTIDDNEKRLDSTINHKKHKQCDVCGKTFYKLCHLTVHLKTHTGEKPFVCSTCGKNFKEKHHLQSHNRIHTKEKPFLCLQCGKCFSENSSLSRHIKIHTNKKDFQCSLCFKRFLLSNDLKRHVEKHSKTIRLKCNLCQKEYSSSSSLSKHKNNHKNTNHPKQKNT